MTHKEFVESLRKQFMEKLKAKTGWGKNEVLHEFDVACILVLTEIVDKAEKK